MFIPEVRHKVHNNNIYFTVYWSLIKKTDKYEINNNVPAVSGIYELYYQDQNKKLNLFFFARAWYGGLRNHLRERSDPELEKNIERKKILKDYECFYRYSQISSLADMADLYYFFACTNFPDYKDVFSSERYENIYVKEISAEKVIDI